MHDYLHQNVTPPLPVRGLQLLRTMVFLRLIILIVHYI